MQLLCCADAINFIWASSKSECLRNKNEATGGNTVCFRGANKETVHVPRRNWVLFIGKAPEKTDGRGSQCQCISTHSKFIPPKTIQDVRLSQRGPHCKNVEIMWALFLNSILPPTGGHFSPYLCMYFQWKDVSLAKPQGHHVLGMRLYIQRNELIPSQCYKQLPDSILNLFLLLSYLRPTSEGRIRFAQHRAQLIT